MWQYHARRAVVHLDPVSRLMESRSSSASYASHSAMHPDGYGKPLAFQQPQSPLWPHHTREDRKAVSKDRNVSL